jgi:hypothetical protein
MEIKTKSGFVCNIKENKVKDWRYVDALAKWNSKNELEALTGMNEAITFLLGDDKARLMEHVTDKNGDMPADAIIKEFKEIQELMGESLKKSQSSQG